MSALSDLLNRYLSAEKFKDLSNRRLADAAGVSHGTINKYRNGIHPAAPSEELLQAFHELLGISLVELREAAGVPRGEPEPYVAPAEFNRLSHTQRAALDEFVRSFVGPQGVSHAVPSDSPTPPRTPRKAHQKQEAALPDESQAAALRAHGRRAAGKQVHRDDHRTDEGA